MRKFFILLGLAVFALALMLGGHTTSQAQSSQEYGGRVPPFTPAPGDGPSEEITPIPASRQPPMRAAALAPVSMFGMNLYLSGLERRFTNTNALADLAAAGGVKVSREELSWANVEPNRKGAIDSNVVGIYDTAIDQNVSRGIDVIGMLLTTPKWASTNPGAGDWYWYQPKNQEDYFDYVRWAVTRWKDKVHTWEIWNEPNHQGTWNCASDCTFENRASSYATLLAGAYQAVKSIDPDARVLIGGLYVHDSTNEGMAFLDRVVADSGGAINFDGLSIHTYMPDRIPEDTRADSVVQNFQYRLNMVNTWIDQHGGKPGEIWITEEGKSTCTVSAECPDNMSWSEDEQASMLARMYGIAMATRRVVHFNYFQFEDKFDRPQNLYGGMAIVRDDLTPKPAYNAYKTMSGLLNGATYVGQGPQMVPGNHSQQPDDSDFAGFDYRFKQGSTYINMVWRVSGSVTVDYPVDAAQVDVVDRDGGITTMTASNGKIQLTISTRPQYIVSHACDSLYSDICPDFWAYSYIECLSDRQVISGYGDGTFKPNNNITRGQLSKVVSNAAGFTEPVSGQSFQDIAPGSPFYEFVQRLSVRNVIGGYPCGGAGEPCGASRLPYFRPNASTTRGQIAKIVSSARGYSDTPSGQSFQDVPPGSPFYPWIQRLASRGVMGGYGCGTAGEPCVAPNNLPYFRPNTNASRAQVSKIVANTFFPECNP
ncbi:MAG TPA: S-layer homology domain-containing protein [Chloroflexia bacterium]|nr:S-layer homology domain-containing protein [Chloroflexia bacterium]